MEKKYLLPALKDGVELHEGIGWQEAEDVYNFLINNLKLYYEPNTSVFDGGSNAYPHMYEQMLIFHNAFLEDHHPEHKRAVLEWRAVLAIMALQRVCNVRVDVVKVDFTQESSNAFLRAARSFRPIDKPVFFNTTWDFLYILRIKNMPITLFSPVTLVCPAKQFLTKIKKCLDNQWLSIIEVNGQEELLFNFNGNTIEYENLVAWLKHLEKNLILSESNGSVCSKKYETVTGELKKYIEDYERYSHIQYPVLYKEKIYGSMNNGFRKEFSFLNYCCDVLIENTKFSFLIERYLDDIFEQKILVLVYDSMPDTMEKEENVAKLDKMFDSVLSLDGKKVIDVHEYGGKRVAACALLPLKETFVAELIQHHIMPEELFEKLEIIYYPVQKQIEVSFKMKGFPYLLRKSYAESDWQSIYGCDMEAVYLWPEGKMRNSGWKLYYMYTGENGKGIDVSLPENTAELRFASPHGLSNPNCFKICSAEDFPAYIRYCCEGVIGYLLIRAKKIGSDKEEKTEYVFLDIGHATTSIALLGNPTSDMNEAENDWRELVLPRSLKVAGLEKSAAVNYNFVGTGEKRSCRYFKNMLHSFACYNRVPNEQYTRRPIEDGQILFDEQCYLNDAGKQIVSYINFEYCSMHAADKERAHIFIEQILLYAVYQAYKHYCSSIDICYTHGFGEDCSAIGELEGLYNNALDRVKSWTGIMKTGKNAIHAVPEYQALACYVFRKIYKKYGMDLAVVPEDSTYIGVNIGWKSTWISFIDSKQFKSQMQTSHQIQAEYCCINYAGRDISLMDEDGKGNFSFKSYPKMLGILMTGGEQVQPGTLEYQLLDEFKELYDSSRVASKEYYQGVFDRIAMKITENGFKVSPDICNNARDFRYFLMTVTYNILLLLLCIGSIQKQRKLLTKQLHIYVGGNGAKLFQWIANDKSYCELMEDNSQSYLILPLQKSILEYIRNVSQLSKAEITISLVNDAEELLTKGSVYWRMGHTSPYGNLTCTKVANGTILDKENSDLLEGEIDKLAKDIFQDIEFSPKEDSGETQKSDPVGNSGENPKTDISSSEKSEKKFGWDAEKIINEYRKNVCERMIDEIIHM